MTGHLDIYPTSDALIRGSAEIIASLLVESVRLRDRAMVALSGGSTPRRVYALLGSEPLLTNVSWEKVHLFWGDERCVPPEHPESNFRMVDDSLLKHTAIPLQNIHRIKSELDPATAANWYEAEIQYSFQLAQGSLPRFDLVLLGLGDDGHTASLFPETLALKEEQKLVTEAYVDKFKSHRITITFPVINNARHVFFLVSGKGKASILANVVQGNHPRYPAQWVHPVAGELRWLVDQDAASQLSPVSEQ